MDENEKLAEKLNKKIERYKELSDGVKLGIKKYLELETNADLSMADEEFFGKMDMAIVDHSSLAGLLIAKGVIDQDDYIDAVIIGAEERVEFYQELIREKHKVRITLV